MFYYKQARASLVLFAAFMVPACGARRAPRSSHSSVGTERRRSASRRARSSPAVARRADQCP